MELKLWHESDRQFDRPDMAQALIERLARPRTASRHANGGLGLHCSAVTVTPGGDIMETPCFGRFLYEVTVNPEHVHEMPIGEFHKLSDSFYDDDEMVARQRERFLFGKVQVLRLVDADGLARQAIVIDLDCITSLSLVPRYAHETE